MPLTILKTIRRIGYASTIKTASSAMLRVLQLSEKAINLAESHSFRDALVSLIEQSQINGDLPGVTADDVIEYFHKVL